MDFYAGLNGWKMRGETELFDDVGTYSDCTRST